MNDQTDVLHQLTKGDERALRQIFDLYIYRVYHFVYRYVKNKEEAEDIAQTVFVKLWENRARVDPEASFEVFLFTVAHRSVIDYFRRRETKRQMLTSHHLNEEAHVSSFNAEELLQHHELQSLYRQAVEALPPKRKEIFLLSRHEGLTNAQIAQRLNISIKTVENQMTAALASLKAFFKQSDTGIIFFLFFFFIG